MGDRLFDEVLLAWRNGTPGDLSRCCGRAHFCGGSCKVRISVKSPESNPLPVTYREPRISRTDVRSFPITDKNATFPYGTCRLRTRKATYVDAPSVTSHFDTSPLPAPSAEGAAGTVVELG